MFENSPLDSVTGITDRTAFEAVENHVHILDDITPGEFKKLLPVAESLGNMLLCCLKKRFPDRKFFVFVSIHVGDSFIIRFHQKWENEAQYYYPEDFNGPKERMFGFAG